MEETPQIFISYCWSNPEHEDWVINLAERLTSDGVEVHIDKWCLKEGQDLYDFMENMVKSSDINKVLIILDKKYYEKAENRIGGVGAEAQIISPEVYSNVSQEKFIPIVKEKDDNENPYIPTFLKSRVFIDLSNNDKYEENYEKLLRNIFKRPAYNKPKLGVPPSYLFEKSPIYSNTKLILRNFENQLNKDIPKINPILRDFLNEFYNNLKNFSISLNNNDLLMFGKEMIDSIKSYTPLRDDYVNFIDKLTEKELDFDIDIIIKFFEKLQHLTEPQDNRDSWMSFEFDNYKFFIYEIFLYTIAVSLKNENYKLIEELLYSIYFFEFNNRISDSYSNRYDVLYNRIDSIDSIDSINDYYYKTYNRNFINPIADLLIERIPNSLTKSQIIDADLICYYIANLENLYWFPITYIYKDNKNIDLFYRLMSLRHFEKVKHLLGVNTVNELQDKLNVLKKENKTGYQNFFHKIYPLYELIDIDKIGTVR